MSGTTAFVADGVRGLQIIDFSNPGTGQYIGCFNPPAALGVRVSGTHAFVSNSDTILVLDVSNPASPSLFKTFQPQNQGDVKGLAASWPNAFVIQMDAGLTVFDASDVQGVTATYLYECHATGADLAFPFVYAACGSGLVVFDALGFRGRVATPGVAENAFAYGNLVFVALGDSGVAIVDVTDPSRPVLKGSVSTGTHVYDVYASGKYAYAAAGTAGVHVLEISDPANPKLKGTYGTPGFARRVVPRGSLVYVADGAAGLEIIDVTDPAHPALKGAYDTPGTANGVYVSGTTVYVADGDDGLQIIDAADPTHPVLKAKLATPGTAWDVILTGTSAWVADDVHGIQLIQIEP